MLWQEVFKNYGLAVLAIACLVTGPDLALAGKEVVATVDTSHLPEPEPLALLAAGLIGLVLARHI